jgi:hypothetical protein
MPAQFRTYLPRYMATIGGVSTPGAMDTSIPGSGRLDGAYELSQFDSYARDLFTDFMSPAFMRWPAPSGQPQNPTKTGSNYNLPGYAVITDHAPSLYPNYSVLDVRPPTQVYPGPYASLSISAPATAMEDTGTLLNASEVYCENSSGYGRLNAYDSHSSNLLFIGTPRKFENYGNDKYVPMHGELPIEQSFFWDMSAAFGTALSVMRLHWVEVSNPWVKTATVCPDGRAPMSDMDSIEDLDRLFLKQLGIDMNAPSAVAVISSWLPYDKPSVFPRRVGLNKVTLNYNIRTLLAGDLLKTATLTSAHRARAMEMMLNDWRMSFLGASPDYFASFRPLDFDGDGYVICSAYNNSEAYSAADPVTSPPAIADLAGVTWPRRLVDGTHALPGRGPAINQTTDFPFSLTGCFTMRKSRYFRVLARGELWDCQLKRPVSNATLESVLCVDPNGLSASNKLGQDVAVMHQRWYWNSYNALLPSIYP